MIAHTGQEDGMWILSSRSQFTAADSQGKLAAALNALYVRNLNIYFFPVDNNLLLLLLFLR